jgi:hypothetical protein
MAERMPTATIESWERKRSSVMALLVNMDTCSLTTLSAIDRLAVIPSPAALPLELVRTALTSSPPVVFDRSIMTLFGLHDPERQ